MKSERKKAAVVPKDDQLRLVLECRSSGLTDRAWCLEHGIKPKTFQNWVARLRSENTPGIPESKRKQGTVLSAPAHEVVRLPSPDADRAAFFSALPCPDGDKTRATFLLELSLPGGTVRVSDGISPELLHMAVRVLREEGC